MLLYPEGAVLLNETNRQQEAFNLLNHWSGNAPKSADPKIELARLLADHFAALSAGRGREQVALERYGHSTGKYTQPFVDAALAHAKEVQPERFTSDEFRAAVAARLDR